MIDKFQGKTRWLSNFEECNITIDGKLYQTTEHAFQAMKTLDHEEHEKVRLASTPGKAKRLGRKVTLRPDWEKIKDDVMYRVNKVKFESNPELKEKLLATGDQELVEGNTWGDRYWGVCGGRGRNQLGKILMKIRDELR